ncbi:hypothetical protein DFH07DRAFT_919534 [Mycena maculata]|uniref:F-box domain-containing protein n=1 Tax=Mycena maculata TaxID=230809 RepID=A0AAD7NF76_9AGAR|nr:hypothetical protein DFH07DRAFT_919534 [Mycena maculata]
MTTGACPRCGFPESAPAISAALPTSLCPELRRSNTAPSDSQYREFRREMETAASALSEIDVKMRYLQRVLNDLADRRQALLDFIADHRRVVTPLRTFPNEILSEIFVQCAERDPSCKWDPRTNPEWILVQVCRRWRTVALSTPRIWGRIFISDEISKRWLESRRISEASVKTILSRQLERSGEVPLAINFSVHVLDLPDAVAQNILDALFLAAYRWQDVNLCVTAYHRFFQPHTPTTSFPQLRTLFLNHEYQPTASMSNSNDPCQFFKSVPCLKELGFRGHSHSHAPWVLTRIHAFPLSQIKKLILKTHFYQMSDALNILRSALNVVELSLEEWYKRKEDTVIQYTPVILQSLRTLSFKEADTSVLSHIVVPALRELAIDGYSPLADQTVFLTRAGSSLTHLTLQHTNSSESETLLYVLTLTPHIVHLALDSSRFCLDEHFMRALTCGTGAQNLVPSVMSLELRDYFTCEGSMLVEMLRSRCAPGSLRSVVLNLRRWRGSPLDLLTFETLRWDRGLEISLVD